MARRIEIVGTDKVWIVKKCIECHLLDSDAMCVIDNKHRPKFEDECENCPLPENGNENEHTAPDGTELVAVQNIDGKCNCDICYYQTIQDGFERCTRRTIDSACCACDRKDKRNIGWALKKNKLEENNG